MTGVEMDDVKFAVASEMVMVDEIPFPPLITTPKPLCLLGYGMHLSLLLDLGISETAVEYYIRWTLRLDELSLSERRTVC